MPISEKVGKDYDLSTEIILSLFDSQYLNLGYWDKKTASFAEAQFRFVDIFGEFSRLETADDVLDAGFGTGQQDLYYIDRYRCRHITGINVSEVQLRLALKKLNENQNYASSIDFRLGDATRLKHWTGNTHDRILALESAQMFDDKIAFFEGAYHVLKSKGYLCIAEPIPKKIFEYTDDLFPAIRKEIFKKFKPSKSGRERFEEKLDIFLKSLHQLILSKQGWHLTHPDYLAGLENAGFAIDGVEDVSRQVFELFPMDVIIKKINELSKSCPVYHPLQELLAAFLVNLCFLKYYAYATDLLGYYLIRARKD